MHDCRGRWHSKEGMTALSLFIHRLLGAWVSTAVFKTWTQKPHLNLCFKPHKLSLPGKVPWGPGPWSLEWDDWVSASKTQMSGGKILAWACQSLWFNWGLCFSPLKPQESPYLLLRPQQESYTCATCCQVTLEQPLPWHGKMASSMQQNEEISHRVIVWGHECGWRCSKSPWDDTEYRHS